MKWTEAQYTAYLKRQEQTPERLAKPSENIPKSIPRQPKHYALIHKSRVTLPILVNILGVALQERFPDVFVPIPCLGIHWGTEAKRIGVNACGWHRAGYERERWVVMPCGPREIVEHMPRILAQVKELL